MSFVKRWYIRDHINGQPRQLWLFDFDAQTATRMDVTSPEVGPDTFFRAEPGENIWDCIRRQTSWSADPERLFHAMTLGPGKYYPRIARPLDALVPAWEPRLLWSQSFNVEKAYVANARSQLTSLTRKLETICQTVQPSESTLAVYGHEIRNLLILAATEAEMHWRGILIANGAPRTTKFNSNEYFKLVEPLKLRDYAINFYDFPDLPPFQPFAGWSRTDPTKSLPWYAAYNGVKHNREDEFKSGTLRCAFEAVAANIALLVAQFGHAALNSPVRLTVPEWPIEEKYYDLPSRTTAEWTPDNFPGLTGTAPRELDEECHAALAEIERLKARITELEEEIEGLRERLGEEAR